MKSASVFFVAAMAATHSAATMAEPATKRPDPLDANAGSSSLRFETGLDVAMRAVDADPAARWREHNERVRIIGGHAGYLRAATPPPAEAKVNDRDKASRR